MSRRRKKLPTAPAQATIESLSHDGRGIAHINGKTTFISGALPQEIVTFVYTNQRGRFDEGKTLEVTHPNPDRVTPKCAHYSLCGGCSLQHLAEDAQITFKQNILLEQLERFGKVSPKTMLPPLRGPIWGYRHKARLGVRYILKKEVLFVGFREKENPRLLTDIKHCEILHPHLGQKIGELRDKIDEISIKDFIPQIEVAITQNRTALIIRHLKALTPDDEAKFIAISQQFNFDIYLQPEGVESIQLFWPKRSSELLTYEYPELNIEYEFHPNDFTQINFAINQAMVKQTLELFELKSNDRVLDLFCGLGNFSLPMAKQALEVIGVEGSPLMVERAKRNAKHNNISNTQFYCADLFNNNFSNTPWFAQNFAKILIDPPRSGALEIIQQIQQFKAKRLIYVSCNPATLARDAGELVHKQGYKLVKAGIMDMFPHTNHVESIAVFDK
ncbi:MAG: 23S rRNA (uracil(1939)-C(5))-methyltransferase RlmD [Proteobacteria bacterium]|nr:23S rRNA (uracil(1939)-C(5))-methyltransferase RlmD [Pseudomonadota bacterium]